jgi:cyclin-dependent kinase 12/13
VTTIREIKVLKCLNHPNLVELKEVVVSAENEDDDGKEGRVAGVMEGGGDLTQIDCCAGVCRSAEFTEKDEPLDYCHGSIYLVLEYVEHDLTGLIDRQYPYERCLEPGASLVRFSSQLTVLGGVGGK